LDDQIKSLDWRVRKARRISPATEEVVAEVLAKAHTLLE
jgi:mRNA-degrading endonuclease toxin of MazEF toxin-antitoxin module